MFIHTYNDSIYAEMKVEKKEKERELEEETIEEVNEA